MPIATPTRLRSPLLGLDIGTYGVRAAPGGSRWRRVPRNANSMGQTTRGWCVHRLRPDGGPRIRPAMPVAGRHDVGHGRDRPVPRRDIEYHTIEIPQAVCTDPTANLDDIVRYELERLTTKTASDLETRHWRLPDRGQRRHAQHDRVWPPPAARSCNPTTCAVMRA